MGVKVTFDKAGVSARVHAACEKATPIITNEFIKDANFYCKEDTGELIHSSLRASVPNEGKAIWDTPYAKKQFYTGRPSKDVNPNASTLWAEKAKRQNIKKYGTMAKKIINEVV